VTSYEPLYLLALDDPVSCVEYANNNVRFDTLGWKRYIRLGQIDKKIKRMVKDGKMAVGGERT
jgi:hypothetical protein